MPALIRLMGHVNRHVVLPRVLRISHVDLPAADLARLRAVVNPRTAAFLAPVHPEFMTDWMIDKELSRRCSPLMACWAASDVVNASPLAQRFWLANGLIANSPGGGGKAYSVRVARDGHGVLLHPEGAVSWQAERVASLRSGTVDMAMQLAQALEAEGDPRPVFVAPIVWRVRFIADVSAALVGEMRLIERACGLTVWPSTRAAERLAAMLSTLLIERASSLGLRRPDLDAGDPRGYFLAQQRVLAEIHARLSDRYGPLSDSPTLALHTIERGIRRRANPDAEGARQDRDLLREHQRLSRLDPALYGRDTMTQEQIAEILKATRMALVTRGFFNTLHNFVPRAVSHRVAHVRVPSPIDIRDAVRKGHSSDSLLAMLHERMQGALDALGAELEPLIGPFRATNPLATRPAGMASYPTAQSNSRLTRSPIRSIQHEGPWRAVEKIKGLHHVQSIE